MENYKLVLPEHRNHYAYLFGGNLLKWVDEIAWIAASLDYPGCKFVTIAMDKVEARRVRYPPAMGWPAPQLGKNKVR